MPSLGLEGFAPWTGPSLTFANDRLSVVVTSADQGVHRPVRSPQVGNVTDGIAVLDPHDLGGRRAHGAIERAKHDGERGERLHGLAAWLEPLRDAVRPS